VLARGQCYLLDKMKNQGMYLLSENVEFEKGSGGKGCATVTFSDKAIHGLVNGGHTYLSIREVAESSERPENWDAHVRVHVIKISEEDSGAVSEIAEGLNRSMQVDDPSLENLKGTFDSIRQSLNGKLGADQIAYRQGDTGESTFYRS
jgi:AIPR protein